jgi:hypothetical protein
MRKKNEWMTDPVALELDRRRREEIATANNRQMGAAIPVVGLVMLGKAHQHRKQAKIYDNALEARKKELKGNR